MADSQADIIGRAQARETGIWAAFAFGSLDSTSAATIATVYGVYGAAGLAMIDAVATEKMALMVADFTLAMNGIDYDEARLAINIAAKRYAATVEDATIAQKLITRQQANAKDQAYIEAQIAALEADRAAITTAQSTLAARVSEAATRITVLQAEIAEEGVRKDEVASDVARKELEVTEAGLRLLQVGVDAAEIRLRINGAALDSARASVDVAEANVRIAELAASGLMLEADAADMQNRIDEAGRRLVGEGINQKQIEAKVQELAWDKLLTDWQSLGLDRDTAAAAAELADLDNAIARAQNGTTEAGDDLAMTSYEAAGMTAKTALAGGQASIIPARATADATLAENGRLAAVQDQAQATTRKLIADEDAAQTATQEASASSLSGVEASEYAARGTGRASELLSEQAEATWHVSKAGRWTAELASKKTRALEASRKSLIGLAATIAGIKQKSTVEDYATTQKKALAAYKLARYISVIISRLQRDELNVITGAKEEAEGVAEKAYQIALGGGS